MGRLRPKDEKPERHHYVPKSLLKEFTNRNNQLFKYDKLNDIIDPAAVSPKTIAAEMDFNTIPQGENKLDLEDAFMTIDNDMAQLVRKIKGFKDKLQFTEKDKTTLVSAAVFLRHRTKKARHVLGSTIAIIEERLAGGIPDDKTVEFYEWKDFMSRKMHFKFMEVLHPIFNEFAKRKIVVFRATKNSIFWISDNPISFYNSKDPSSGIGIEGTNAYFPITKNLLIAFFCPSICQNAIKQYELYIAQRRIPPKNLIQLIHAIENGGIIDVDETNFFNFLQVASSLQFILSSENDFSYAREVLAYRPEFKKEAMESSINSRAEGYFKIAPDSASEPLS